MSHTMNIKLEVKDFKCLVLAAGRAGAWCDVMEQNHALCDGVQVSGIGVKLPGWVYPAVFDVKAGVVHYDVYEGAWGNIDELNKLKAYYGLEVAKKAAKRQGYLVQEVVRDNEIVLRISVGA